MTDSPISSPTNSFSLPLLRTLPFESTMSSHHHSFTSPFIHDWMVGNTISTNSLPTNTTTNTTTININLSNTKIPSLVTLCQQEILNLLDRNAYNSRLVKDLCKYIPEELLEPIFEKLIDNKKINDIVLMIYLSPARSKLIINNIYNIRNSIFKLIGYNCPNLISLDLSDCIQISNSVIRTILTGCSQLECIKLDRCQRITDTAFDLSSTPFQSYVSCLSLKCISLQGCPQITGEVISIFNKNYRSLLYLNLSQCKHMKSQEMMNNIFQHRQLQILNLSFIDVVTDETFSLLPIMTSSTSSTSLSIERAKFSQVRSTSPVIQKLYAATSPSFASSESTSPLQVLNLCKCRITDKAIAHFVSFQHLKEVRLPWCTGITDHGVMMLVEYCDQIQILDLTSCSITDVAVRYVGKLAKKQLRELDLSWCMEITNNGLRYLLPAYGDEDIDGDAGCYVLGHDEMVTSHLEKLSLIWCSQVNNESLEILSNLPALKLLAVNGCYEVTSEAVHVLQQSGIDIIL
mmetsp:Transcript_5899/g.6496  ORF Transcript_5899/g.6496 Transcript_5899/m.6496 type:complete len:517 (+) Transcript_5899:209-1759(+)|eukprot:gene2909-3095_t